MEQIYNIQQLLLFLKRMQCHANIENQMSWEHYAILREQTFVAAEGIVWQHKQVTAFSSGAQ